MVISNGKSFITIFNINVIRKTADKIGYKCKTREAKYIFSVVVRKI